MQSRRLLRLLILAENKYNQLLIVLIVLLLSVPFVSFSKIGAITTSTLFIASLVLINYRLHFHHKQFKLYLGVAIFEFILQTLRIFEYSSFQDTEIAILHTLILVIFTIFSIVGISKEVSSSEKVKSDTIKGGICIYLLIAFSWANVYSIIYLIDENSFHGVVQNNFQADLLYFSMTSLTTVGYGDIYAVGPTARMLANLQGIIGVMYPTIFIARLVGLYSKN